MGAGDELMITGEAVRLGCSPDDPLIVTGKDGKRRWHPLFDGNPRFLPLDVPTSPKHNWHEVKNHPGWRPYVLYAERGWRKGLHNQTDDLTATNRTRWVFHPTWRATPGELYIPKRPSGRFIVLEPNMKSGGVTSNKQWGWNRWQRLVDLMPGVDFVQLGPRNTKMLGGARLIETPSFIHACTELSGAWAAVLPEGGLHHAAAALGVPAVVLFGGSRSVFNTGYDSHVNLADVDPETRACGSRQPCQHCEEIWRRLTPEIVAEALGEVMAG